MTLIKEIIKINGGYTSYVDLFAEYRDPDQKLGRMERYKPISAHRHVFEKVANAINITDRRFYFISGSYGTGKSHLLLMLANFFATPSTTPEMEKFFANYLAAQRDVKLKPNETLNERNANSIKQMRQDGKYLIAICRFDLNLDFEGALLRALNDSIELDRSDFEVNSYYQEALRKIKDWRDRSTASRFFADLENFLDQDPQGYTIEALEDGLRRYDQNCLATFQSAYKIVTDTDFTFSKDNLQDILTDLIRNQAFKDRYKGIVFLFDEFGSAIEDGRASYSTLLGFSQYCAESSLQSGGAIIFIGTGHKAFDKHGSSSQYSNMATLQARVNEIALQAQGMEDIISAIVQPIKSSPGWQHEVLNHSAKFTNFSAKCNQLHLFDWLSSPIINHNIIQNIYPMHPLATYAVIRLATEVGSDNRSVVKFFSPEFDDTNDDWSNVQPYSYPWFIQQHAIQEDGKLKMYTADLLVDYFEDSLKPDDRGRSDQVKTAVQDYHSSLKELARNLAENDQSGDEDAWAVKLIKIMLIHVIISNDTAPILNNLENIQFSMDAVSASEKDLIRTKLDSLTKLGVIHKDRDVYELLHGDRKDIRGMIETYKSNSANKPTNPLELFVKNVTLSAEQFLIPNEYNDEYGEDKRLKIVYASPAMLESEHKIDGLSVSYYSFLDHERKQKEPANSYEGIVIQVFCETDAEIAIAKQAARRNDNARVLICIPKRPLKVIDPLFTLEASNSPEFTAQAANFATAELQETNRIKAESIALLKEANNIYSTNQELEWFGLNGRELSFTKPWAREAANHFMRERYAKNRTPFPHTDLNKSHQNLSGAVKTTIVAAGNQIINASEKIEVNFGLPDNNGIKKYLRKVFVNQQILKVTGQSGDIHYTEVEKDIHKFQNNFPAYAKLLNSLKAIEGDGARELSQFLAPFYEEEGLGEIALTLMLILARRYFGDSLRLKNEPDVLSDLRIEKTEDILELVQGKKPRSVIMVEPISQADRDLFGILRKLFAQGQTSAGKEYSIQDAYSAIEKWWGSLPTIARTLPLDLPQHAQISSLFSIQKQKDPYYFIKKDLLEVLGFELGHQLNSEDLSKIEVDLKAYRNAIETIQSKVEENILKEFSKIFATQTSLDTDIQDAMADWFSGLTQLQKESNGYTYHNGQSKPLVKNTAFADIRTLLFGTLPEAYGLGKVKDWNRDQTEAYSNLVSEGKAHIETRAPKVPKLRIQFTGHDGITGTQVSHNGKMSFSATTENGEGIIYYTLDSSDPKDRNNANRKVLEPGVDFAISGTKTLQIVVGDNEGNVGHVDTYVCFNQYEKFTIKPPEQRRMGDEPVTFMLPKDAVSAKTALLSLVNYINSAKLMDRDEQIAFIQDQLKKDVDG